MGLDYYQILGLSTAAATDGDIKKAYHRGALRWHPDKNPNQKEAAESRFKQLLEAYEALRDPLKRAVYDKVLKSQVRPPRPRGAKGASSTSPSAAKGASSTRSSAANGASSTRPSAANGASSTRSSAANGASSTPPSAAKSNGGGTAPTSSKGSEGNGEPTDKVCDQNDKYDWWSKYYGDDDEMVDENRRRRSHGYYGYYHEDELLQQWEL